MRLLAREVGTDHDAAERLWSTGIHDARILATMIEDPASVDGHQMDRWAGEVRTWDLCDECCLNLYWRTQFAYDKVQEWSLDSREYVKRAAFALAATPALHDRKRPDDEFVRILPLVTGEAVDSRPHVKNAVSWALRQMGKRSARLHFAALLCARDIAGGQSLSAKWIAADTIRELESERVRSMLGLK